MNNPEHLSNSLNFNSLFKKSKAKYQKEIKINEKLSRSELVIPAQQISHRTPTFIPKCPYGRSSSVSSNRKLEALSDINQHIGIFSARINNFSYNQSADINKLSNLEKSIVSRPTSRQKARPNPLLLTKADRFELLKLQFQSSVHDSEQVIRRAKIRGLKVRTGSQARKTKQKVQFDYNNVLIKGKKLAIADK